MHAVLLSDVDATLTHCERSTGHKSADVVQVGVFHGQGCTEELAKKFMKAEFTFDDLMKQMEALQKMGPLKQIMSMIPGMGAAKIPDELLGVQEGKMKSWKHIIQSMTKQERDNPDLIDGSRVKRIAKGSGKSEQDVRELIKQYNTMKKIMKQMGNQKQMQKLQKMFGGKMPMGL